jgi:hypothetical protein
MSSKNYNPGGKYDEMVDSIQVHYGLKNRQDSLRMAIDIVFNTLVKEGIKTVPMSISSELTEMKQLLIEIKENTQEEF